MKRRVLLVLVCLVFMTCKNNENQSKLNSEKDSKDVVENFKSYGELITEDNAKSIDEMSKQYQNLKVGDTITSKMKGKIVDVCSKKGCWMTLDMGEETVMVRFKDYGFFVPTDAQGEVIVKGKAFVSETSVEDLKHYAEDDGKSPEEIDKITQPKMTYKFLADGVLLEKNGS